MFLNNFTSHSQTFSLTTIIATATMADVADSELRALQKALTELDAQEDLLEAEHASRKAQIKEAKKVPDTALAIGPGLILTCSR